MSLTERLNHPEASLTYRGAAAAETAENTTAATDYARLSL
jgi:hypothetical protein